MDNTMSHFNQQFYQRVQASRPLLILMGILLTISGFVFITFSYIGTLTSVYMFGFLMIFGGVLQIATAFKISGGWHRIAWILFGFLYFLAGVFSFQAPLATAAALTWLVSFFLIFGGAVRIINAFQMKSVQGWGWVLTSGFLLLITGVLISINPTSPLWVLGLFLGIDLFVQGINLLSLAFVVKKLQK